ncbi:MAG: helix-turn-helix transcriptional regulator [Solirubrobacteraceae bacterium]
MGAAVTGGGLLDRGDEFSRIESLFEAVASGEGRLAVIEAPAGIGKTSLLAALTARAATRGWRVLSARGSELEREFAFGVTRQLFEPVIASSSPAVRKRLLAGAARLATPIVWFADAGEEADAFARLHGLYWLTSNLAGTGAQSPVVLAIDDAHLADRASLRYLAYIANRLAELPILVAVATRSGELEEQLEPLASLYTSQRSELLRPQPLSGGAVGEMVKRRLGGEPEPGFVRACHAATGGNPFFLSELLGEVDTRGLEPTDVNASQIGEVGPRSLARTILHRLARLGPEAIEIVRAVVILGDGSPLRDVAELAGVGLGAAREVTDALARVAILTADPAPGFAHQIVAAAVESDLRAHARAHWHKRAADLLVSRGASPERVAAHLLKTAPGGDADAWTILHEAARDADARGAPDASIAYLTRALSEAPHGELRRATLVALGAAEAHAGLPPAVEHLSEALQLAATAAQRRAVALELGRALMLSGRLGEAVEVFERALEEPVELDQEQRELAMLVELELVGAARFDPATRPLVGQRLTRVGQEITGDTPAERLVLAHLAFEMVYDAAPIERIVETAERALADRKLLSEQGTALPVTGLPVWAMIFCERYESAQRAADAVLRAARAQGSVSGFSLASAIQATIAGRLGRLAEAEEWARAALRPDTPRIEAPMALAALIDALVDTGQLEAAKEALRAAGLAGEVPDLPIFGVLLGARARMRLAEGNPEGALADAIAVGERAAAWGNRNKTLVQWRAVAALAKMAIGDVEGAHEIATEGVAGAREWGAARAVGIELRALASVEGGEQGIELLREAVVVLEGTGARLELARANADLGAALRRRGLRRDARPLLLDALEGAMACGAHVLLEQVRTELHAAGARPRGVVRSGVEALTASERRVARLAADGLTNREIAQALFVSRGTVESHLHSVYGKLDIGSRRELSDALERPAAGTGTSR